MRLFILLFCSGILTACVSAQKPATIEPVTSLVPLSQKQLDAIREAVVQGLKDPYSATVSNVVAGKSGSVYVACGLLNAKNGFGAYVGDRWFSGILIGMPDKPAFIVTGDMSEESSAANKVVCAQRFLK